MVLRRWPQSSSGIPCCRGFPIARGWSSCRTGLRTAAVPRLSRPLKDSCASQTRFAARSPRMARTNAVEATGRKLDLPYGSLVSGLGALVVVLFVASLAIGYLRVDLLQGFSDAGGAWTPPALVLVELIAAAPLGCLAGFSLGLTGAALRDCCAWRSRALSGCRAWRSELSPSLFRSQRCVPAGPAARRCRGRNGATLLLMGWPAAEPAP